MSQGHTGVDLDAAVSRVALLLGERAGHCTGCGRPVRLVGGGLVPAHRLSERGGPRTCPGAEKPPVEPETFPCAECGALEPLRGNGTVKAHRPLIMGRDGPYRAQRSCRGAGRAPSKAARHA